MPALYRMPVFYLVLMMGVGAYALAGGKFRPPADPVRAEAPAPEPIRVAPSTAEEEASDRSDGILRTVDGLRRKVLVRDLAVVCTAGPDGGKAVGAPLDYFAIRYVYGAEPPGDPTRFLVGPRDGPAQGWVPAPSVLEWDTRLMARPTPRAGRPPLVIYRDESCLIRSLDGAGVPDILRLADDAMYRAKSRKTGPEMATLA